MSAVVTGSSRLLLRFLATALVVAVPVVGCTCDDEVALEPGSVAGRACHPDTGIGLAQAVVRLSGDRDDLEVVANGAGTYNFPNVTAGTVTVTATLGDVTRVYEGVQVLPGEAVFVDDGACAEDPQPPNTGNLDGQVCNRHTGDLVQDAEVILQTADGSVFLEHTEADGTFLVRNIPTGSHVVKIRGTGFERDFRIDIRDGETTTLDLADDCRVPLASQGGVQGYFCDPTTSGNLVGATVVVSNDSDSISDLTDTDGEFKVNGLEPGVYRVQVTHPNHSYNDENVVVTPGSFADVEDVQNCQARPELGTIEGFICDIEAGGRFEGTVELAQAAVVASTATDAEGRFAFSGVVPGTYTVRAFRAGYERVFSGVVVTAFQTTFIQEENCPEPEDVCTQFENIPEESADGRILLVVDKSGSMNQAAAGFSDTKWNATRQALSNVTSALQSTVEFGLLLYPEGDFCNAGGLEVGLGLNRASAIQSELNGTFPEGGTPTATTLAQARNVLAPLASDGRPLAVLLATDGGPNCNTSLNPGTCACTRPLNEEPGGVCSNFNCLDDQNVLNQVDQIRNLGVNTYVLGIPGVEDFVSVLNQMAQRGGTALPGLINYYEVTDQASLQQQLEAITRRVLTCRIDVGASIGAASSIAVTLGAQIFPRDLTRQNGWDAVNDTTIELFGAACNLASSSPQNVVVTRCVAP